MRLSQFILDNIEPILQEWEDFARSLAPGDKMEALALRNDAESILRSAVRDMRTTQTLSEQRSKSKGHGGAGGLDSDALDGASTLHGAARFGSGFDVSEVISEYRALRASVLRLWSESLPAPDFNDIADITRFNEAIDQSLAKAVVSFAHGVDRSRKMFLAILGHDLRNPLNSIKMSACLAAARSKGDEESSQVLSGIDTSVRAMSQLVLDLLDFAAIGLGAGMPVKMAPVDLERLAHEVLEEMRAANPGRSLHFNRCGDLKCVCDATRLRQVISNLLGNALAHGAENRNVDLSLVSGDADIRLAVRNQGPPIPPKLLPTLFDPLIRDTSAEAEACRNPGSLGLGLFISREIVHAHGGTINVTSSAESGTVFTVCLPRRPANSDDSASFAGSEGAEIPHSLRTTTRG